MALSFFKKPFTNPFQSATNCVGLEEPLHAYNQAAGNNQTSRRGDRKKLPEIVRSLAELEQFPNSVRDVVAELKALMESARSGPFEGLDFLVPGALDTDERLKSIETRSKLREALLKAGSPVAGYLAGKIYRILVQEVIKANLQINSYDDLDFRLNELVHKYHSSFAETEQRALQHVNSPTI